MKPSRLPFNLLVVFEALMTNLHVTKAAAQLGVTQAAVSESLAKLRELFNDKLFIRATPYLIPTALAENIIEPVRQVINDTQNICSLQMQFDPKKSKRVFKIGMSSYVEILLLPSLLENIKKSAPNIKIVIRSKESSNRKLLETGSLDFSILTFPESHHIELPETLVAQKLLTDKIGTCTGRKNNPIFKKKMDIKTYLSADHICSDETEITNYTAIDNELKKRKLKRNIVLSTPHFGLIPFSLLETNYIATLSNKIAKLYADSFPLKIVDAPVSGSIDIYQVWHPRNKYDPGHIWLRKKILDIAEQL